MWLCRDKKKEQLIEQFVVCVVFRYLIEIAKIYNIEYEPDPLVMRDDARPIGKICCIYKFVVYFLL